MAVFADIRTVAAHLAIVVARNKDCIEWSDWAAIPRLYRALTIGYEEFWYSAAVYTASATHVASVVRDAIANYVAPPQCKRPVLRFNMRGDPRWNYLAWASMRGSVEAVDMLLQQRADDPCGEFDPTYDDSCAMRIACEYGRCAVVERLLQDSRTDHTASCAVLESSGCIGMWSIMLNSHLVLAAEFGHSDIVRVLLDDPLRPDGSELVALDVAKRNSHLDVVRILVADPRCSN
ncbi:hypothetical protein HDU84_001783 [Entophlyctis sp. JEL0112]|nr:hypothetical protein HDU84_001783 [Entophlyctis sp. JEL0112]